MNIQKIESLALTMYCKHGGTTYPAGKVFNAPFPLWITDALKRQCSFIKVVSLKPTKAEKAIKLAEDAAVKKEIQEKQDAQAKFEAEKAKFEASITIKVAEAVEKEVGNEESNADKVAQSETVTLKSVKKSIPKKPSK